MLTELQLNEKLQTLSTLVTRAQLATRLGSQYDGNRDVYQALGYKKTLVYADFYTQYERQDIAKAIINRPVQATWSGDIKVLQADDEEETEFEKAWTKLWKSLQLKTKFIRLDKLSRIGRYGVLLLGLDDVSNVQGWKTPVKKGKRKLLYVKPLSEGSIVINQFNKDTSSERFGKPDIYSITVKLDDNSSQVLEVHYSRLIHVAGELLESEIYGEPALKAVFNRLQDLEKLVGASAEMFWRGARPGYKGTVDKDFTLTPTAKEDLQAQLDEYENNLRRFLINEGVDIEALTSQVADPRYHVDVQLQMISAETGIPKRILVGSERGELASTTDQGAWYESIKSRREDYVEPQILTPFIDYCIEYGILPTPAEDAPYKVFWPDIFSPSEKDRAEIGKTRAAALMSYMNNPAAEIIIPPEAFIEYMLGLEDEDIEHVKLMHKDFIEESMNEELNQLRATLVNQPAGGGGRPPATGAIGDGSTGTSGTSGEVD
jgi:hypothetical protein